MSDERPVHSHDEHFDRLLAGRVVTEAMTNFPEGTPLVDVLRWIHERLSLSEAGNFVVDGFSADAEYFQPTFDIGAIKHEEFPDTFTMNARFPVTPIDPEFIPVGAWFTGKISAAAFIKGEQPRGQYYHYDTFSNQQLHGWGFADTVGYYTYVQNIPDGQSTQTYEYSHRKVDVDPEPADFVYDYRGQYYQNLPWPHGSADPVYGETHLQDKGVLNKRILILAKLNRTNILEGADQKIYFRGGQNYVWQHGNAVGGGIGVCVDGVLSSDISTLGTDWTWYKIEALDNVVRVKVWAQSGSEPSAWMYENDTASLTPGNTYIDFNQSYGGIIVPEHPGAKTHEFRHISVEGINTGPIHANAYLRPSPFNAAAWLSSGDDWQVNAFVLPTFRADSLIVEYVPGDFTIGAFKEGRWEYDWPAEAFVGGYGKLDAVIGSDAVFGQLTADAWKVITTEDSALEDAVVKDIDRTYGLTGDGVIKDLALPGSFTSDAYKNLLIEGSHTIDGYLGPGAHPPFDAIVKRPDQTGSFAADAVTWPQGVELFVANAVKFQPDSDSGALATMDSAFVDVGRDHIAHYDEFNRYYVDGLGNPSGVAETPRGRYSIKEYGTSTEPTAELGRWDVTGNRVEFVENSGYNHALHTDAHIPNDREFYMEHYHSDYGQLTGTDHFKIGIISEGWAGAGGQDIHLKLLQETGSAKIHSLVVNGVTRATFEMRSSSRWVCTRARLIDSTLWWKHWRRDEESEPDWSVLDMSAYWTPVDGPSYMSFHGGGWFGYQGPFYHYITQWKVESLGGWPHGLDADAVIKDLDRTYTHDANAYFVPQPFKAEAFIEPWFSAQARIWLGTTFPADAVRQVTETFGGYEMYPSGPVGVGTYWAYNDKAASIDTDTARICYWSSGKGGVVSKETFAPGYGNAFPSVTDNTWEFYISAGGRDSVHCFLRDSVHGTWATTSDYGYGFVISDYSNTVTDVINGSVGSGTSVGISMSSATKFSIQYIDNGNGTSHMKCYDANGTLLRTSASFTTPYWSSFRMGFAQRNGIISGDAYVYYSPNLGSWKDGMFIDAVIQPGAHIPFDAQFTGSHIDAILKTVGNLGSFDIDVVKHQLGEQLKSLTADAWAAASFIAELYKTQFGSLELGRLQWGDVTPEVEQWQMTVNSIIKAAQTGSLPPLDAYLENPYEPEVLESILGDMQPGEDGFGWALKAFYAAAVLRRAQEEGFTSDAYFVKGFLRADAFFALAGGQALWNYDEGRTGDFAPGNSLQALQNWEGDNR